MRIRLARRRDAPVLAAFNAAMALETEGKVLFPEVVGAGVRRLLYRRAAGTYRKLGMDKTRYAVFEELKPGIRFFTPTRARRRRPSS